MLLEGKKAVIFGVANDKSIAYGIARQFREQGARLAFSYVGDALKKRVEPISEELGGDFTFNCDVSRDEDLASAAALAQEKWGTVDILIHSVAFANRDELKGRYIDTSRAGFALALDISAYSLVAMCHAFEPLLAPDASVLTMTYHGSSKVITNYNVMGVAKAALEASVRYLACDLGLTGRRINAISAGPVKTLAASGVSGFNQLMKHLEERAPLHRHITPDDVGRTAVFLSTDMARGITGEVIYVDSGYHIMGV